MTNIHKYNIHTYNDAKGIIYHTCINTCINMFSPSVTSQVKIVELSDLHLWTEDMIGKKNVNLAIQAIELENPDIIVISGDIANWAEDLENKSFVTKLQEIIRRLTNGRLCVITRGNHDILTPEGKKCERSISAITKGNNDMSTLEEKNFEIANDKLLNEALMPLENVFFLDDVTNLYLKDNKLLADKCLSTANVNFIGGDLPWDFYFTQGENYEAFKQYWHQKFEHENVFKDGTINILDLHALGNFVQLCKDLEFGTNKVDLALSGHQHGGLVPEGLSSIIPGNRGIIAPSRQLLPKYQRGVLECGNTLVSIGNSTNVRVETPIINNLSIYGPSIRVIHLIPSIEKEKPMVYRKSIKFI